MNKKALWWVIGLAAALILIGVIWIGARTAKAPEIGSTYPMPTGTAGVMPPSGVSSSASTSASASGTPEMTETFHGSYANSAFSLTYPSGWTITAFSPTLSMTTFGNAYVNNDVIPEGGAEIDIATTTVYNNLPSIIQTELLSATNIATGTVTISGILCDQAGYSNTYSGGGASQDIAIYCPRGNELWKMYLSYRANDPAARQHVTDFESVLASMKLL